jgi:hypothetical protein
MLCGRSHRSSDSSQSGWSIAPRPQRDADTRLIDAPAAGARRDVRLDSPPADRRHGDPPELPWSRRGARASTVTGRSRASIGSRARRWARRPGDVLRFFSHGHGGVRGRPDNTVRSTIISCFTLTSPRAPLSWFSLSSVVSGHHQVDHGVARGRYPRSRRVPSWRRLPS